MNINYSCYLLLQPQIPYCCNPFAADAVPDHAAGDDPVERQLMEMVQCRARGYLPLKYTKMIPA